MVVHYDAFENRIYEYLGTQSLWRFDGHGITYRCFQFLEIGGRCFNVCWLYLLFNYRVEHKKT